MPSACRRVPGEAAPGRRLRIGIDATCLASRRGYGRFLRELLPALLEADDDHEYTLFADRETAAGVDRFPVATVQPLTSTSQAGAASARGSRGLRDLWIMGRAVARERLDCMFFPSVYSYFPVPSRVPVVVAFHDVIAERHGDIVFPTRRNRWLWNVKVALARYRARAIITVSEWSRRALAERFGIPLERISVALEAPAPAFQPAADPLPRRAWLRKQGWPEDAQYLIYVGGFNPHKNLTGLVDAFAALVHDDPGSSLRLLLVGDFAGDVFHADVSALRERIARARLEDRVYFPGFVPDDELRHLYAGALCLVLPSLEEGFGLPAVEAAACGTACVATRNSPLPELLEGAGIFVDPTEPALLRGALERFVREPGLREKLGAVALSRAGALSWRDAAEVTRRTLEAAAARVP